MNNLTVVTKLRFDAALAPAILVPVALVLALALLRLGTLPREIYDESYTALRAAYGMTNALAQMDWGRMQPDGAQIVIDQQRRFIDWTETARAHMATQAQAEKIARIAEMAKPLFDAMRARPADDSLEPRIRDLTTVATELISADETMMLDVAASTEAFARTRIYLMAIGAIVVPWIVFAILFRMTGGLLRALKEVRHNADDVLDRDAAAPAELGAIDRALTSLGLARRNPMLAE